MNTINESSTAATGWWARRYPRWRQPVIPDPGITVNFGPVVAQIGPVRIHRSALYALAVTATIGVVYVVLAIVTGFAWLIGVSVMVLWIYVSGFHHEAAHALIARRHGDLIDGYGLRGGGAYLMYTSPTGTHTPRTAFLIAAAGPASNLAVATILTASWVLVGAGWDNAAQAAIGYAAIIELTLVTSNLVPFGRTDGHKLRQALRAARPSL